MIKVGVKLKKYILIILSLFILTSCNKTEGNEKVEEKIIEEEITQEEITEEKAYSFEFQNGEKIEFDEMKIYVYAQDLRISAESFIPYEFSIGNEEISDYINMLSKLNYENSKDIFDSAYDDKTMVINLDKDKRIEMIESKPYSSDGLYYYNFYKNDELKSVLTSEIDIKSKIFEIDIENRLKSDITKDWFSKENNPIGVYAITLVDRFYENGNLIILANVFNENFSYANGIFDGESGFAMPIEYRYNFVNDKEDLKNSKYEFGEIILAEDGAEFGPSVKEMSRGNEETYKKLMDSQNSYANNYNYMMNRLSYLAKEEGLENFSHKIEEIPGYENDVIYIESRPNHIEGTVEIAKSDEYEKAKKNEEGANWPHCEGVVYHKETGIAVKTYIDYFE